jgi:hypothetical protein
MPLAEDQRYCLQCGERAAPMSSVLLAGPPLGARAQAAPGATPPSPQGPPGVSPPRPPGSGEDAGRGNALTVIAGVGVLLLAMGIGVLIGRSTHSKPSGAAPQVISVQSSTPSAGAPAAEPFTDDWPVGSGGYTVQLQTLPVASTQVSAVETAKADAEGKGAKSVGALKTDDFAGMTAGNYVIYAGKYKNKAEAEKALPGLKKSFPGASVLHVGVSGAGKSSDQGAGAKSGSGSSGVGSDAKHPAPPSVVESLKSKSGKSYEEQSKNLPNVVSTG